MSAIRDGCYEIMLDKPRHFYFSTRVLDKLTDKIGGFEKLPEALSKDRSIKLLIWLLTTLLNEGAQRNAWCEQGNLEGVEVLSEDIVGLLIGVNDIPYIKEHIFKAFSYGLVGSTAPPESAPGDEPGEEKNVESG